jgi:invasion protein IalB
MRFFLSFLFALLLLGTGVAVVTMSAAEQGGWSLNLPVPRIGSDAPADAPRTETGTTVAEAPQPAAAPQATGSPPGELAGEPMGDWLLNCSASPKTSVKRCSIMQQLSDQNSRPLYGLHHRPLRGRRYARSRFCGDSDQGRESDSNHFRSFRAGADFQAQRERTL